MGYKYEIRYGNYGDWYCKTKIYKTHFMAKIVYFFLSRVFDYADMVQRN